MCVCVDILSVLYVHIRECWCAQQLLSISPKLDDKECNLPCDGDQTQICGGALKLTVSFYLLSIYLSHFVPPIYLSVHCVYYMYMICMYVQWVCTYT